MVSANCRVEIEVPLLFGILTRLISSSNFLIHTMSDPFFVIGSAVGAIYLGPVVCGEIVAYGRAYRDYGEDIRKMTTKAESLCIPLKAL